MFFVFFELRWSAIHGHQILRVFFSDNQYFRMFLVSMPLLCEPNDAVRAVAVAKRREYSINTSVGDLKWTQITGAFGTSKLGIQGE